MTPHIVYVVTNLANGKSYVGKTSRSSKERWSEHLTDSRHPKTLFHRAIKAHGKELFIVNDVAKVASNKEACEREREWISLLNSQDKYFGYNLTLGGDGVQANDATRLKISRTMKERGLTGPVKKGDKLPPEWVKNMSESRLGKPSWSKGIKWSEERKHKHSLLRLSKNIPAWNKDKHVRSDVKDSDLIRMYVEENKNCRQIASVLGTSYATVAWRLKRAGTQMRPAGFQKKITKESKNE